MGRPGSFNQETANDILSRVALGENIDRITQEEGYPSKPTVYAWFKEYPEFFNDYACARAMRAEARSDRLDEIKERVLAGEIPPDVARVAIDVEKWQAGKENPKKYGDKTLVGSDPENPLPSAAVTVALTAELQSKSVDELTRLFTERMKD